MADAESAAPVGGSAGTGSCQGAQSQNAQAHSGGRDSGKGAARGAHDGTVCAGGVFFTEAGKTNLNFRWEVSGKPGAALFFPRRAHLLTTCKTGGGMPAASCALRGGFRFLRKATDNATAFADAAVIVCAIGQIPSLQPTLFSNRLRKPATGSFAAEMDRRSARPFSLLRKRNRKKKTR